MKRLISLIAGLACAAPVMAQPDGLVYALDLRSTREFFTFDPANAAGGITLIDDVNVNANDALFAMDFSVDANTLWAVTFPVNEWGTISLTDGMFSSMGIVSGDVVSGVDNVGGMSFDPTDGTCYISTGTALFTLDTGTGAASLVGFFNSAGLMIDIAIDSQGNMYGMDIVDDSLYSIDKTTGNATVIGPHGLLANFAQGMDFDWSDDTLYGAIYTGSGTGQWCSYNLNDGSVNQLFNTQVWGNGGFGVEMEVAIRSAVGGGNPCPGDIADDNGTPGADGQVSFGDFLASLGLLGPCGPATSNPDCTGDNADDNGTPGGDGQVSFGDFLFLLGVLGPCP